MARSLGQGLVCLPMPAGLFIFVPGRHGETATRNPPSRPQCHRPKHVQCVGKRPSLHERAETFPVYGDPFIDLATGRRLRTLTDARGGRGSFLTRVRAMWRACRTAGVGFTIAAPDSA